MTSLLLYALFPRIKRKKLTSFTIKRTHGGALSLHQIAIGRAAKKTIKDIESIKDNYLFYCLKALSMIENNDVIFLTSLRYVILWQKIFLAILKLEL